jgi:hypothetical protein
MLRLFSRCHDEVSELWSVELRPAPPEHLRSARSRRGIRAEMRELLLIRHDVESSRLGPNRMRVRHYLANLDALGIEID